MSNSSPTPEFSSSSTPPVYRRYDGEVIALRRRIAALEGERAAAIRAVNELLVRASALEQRLQESMELLERERAAFAECLRAQTTRSGDESARLHATIAQMQASRIWRFVVFVRSMRRRRR